MAMTMAVLSHAKTCDPSAGETCKVTTIATTVFQPGEDDSSFVASARGIDSLLVKSNLETVAETMGVEASEVRIECLHC